jgi:transcriptional regulator with XRE-family HTH domain
MPSVPSRRFRFDGSRLRAVRESRGLTREELAVRMPCSVSRISHAELNYHTPHIEVLAELAAALGVRVDDLLVLDDEVTS